MYHRCGGACAGTMDLPLPAGSALVELTIGMHYNNPLCRGVISLGHAGDIQANGRASFHSIFDNMNMVSVARVVTRGHFCPGAFLTRGTLRSRQINSRSCSDTKRVIY